METLIDILALAATIGMASIPLFIDIRKNGKYFKNTFNRWGIVFMVFIWLAFGFGIWAILLGNNLKQQTQTTLTQTQTDVVDLQTQNSGFKNQIGDLKNQIIYLNDSLKTRADLNTKKITTLDSINVSKYRTPVINQSFGSQPRVLTFSMERYLISWLDYACSKSNLSTKKCPIRIDIPFSNPEAFSFGKQVEKFLVKEGYNILYPGSFAYYGAGSENDTANFYISYSKVLKQVSLNINSAHE